MSSEIKSSIEILCEFRFHGGPGAPLRYACIINVLRGVSSAIRALLTFEHTAPFVIYRQLILIYICRRSMVTVILSGSVTCSEWFLKESIPVSLESESDEKFECPNRILGSTTAI